MQMSAIDILNNKIFKSGKIGFLKLLQKFTIRLLYLYNIYK